VIQGPSGDGIEARRGGEREEKQKKTEMARAPREKSEFDPRWTEHAQYKTGGVVG
jgi:hypothetical protein